ncbi:alpha/beta fold hydrolase [Streptomyces rubiginosohelvolus]|uniref:alpha/beta fold hydrolase n=1 Tax=Streptomyces rubiginosohelvolus TaxID=67362 RepID=UPI0033AFB344
MPEAIRQDGARIHYEVHGDGFPVLLLAPGHVSSGIDSWNDTFYNPVRELSQHFKVIAMDQRHAGRSVAPALPFSYEQTVGDQLAVLDAVGAEKAHVVAAEFGCVHAWRLAHDAPERVRSIVAQEPAGRDADNTLGDFFQLFDATIRLVRAAGFDDPETEGLGAVFEAAARDGVFARNPEAGPFAARLHDDEDFRKEMLAFRREKYITLLVRFRDAMFPDGRAHFSVPDQWTGTLAAPLLVLPGDSTRQPRGLAERIAAEAPEAALLAPGFDAPARREETVASIVEFLLKNNPS